LIAPSAIPTKVPYKYRIFKPIIGETPQELSAEEIEELEDRCVAGASRIKKAGFDGIEFHRAHGYLLAEFISPYSNRRSDYYGGSFEKRLTFPLDLIKKTREKVGRDFLIGFRISGDEHIEEGFNLDDAKKIVKILEEASIDYIHLSSGRYEAVEWASPDKEGVMLPEAKALKEILNIPVICPNIHEPYTAKKALEEGMVDMIALGRASLADQDWPLKVQQGKITEINKCIFCFSCFYHVFARFSVRCKVNPLVGRERFVPKYYPLF
jgi:2,4-dienoyl-CoA reductase-like NADH-dependent reductase (Old Yellow Enzyme family)